MRSVIARLGAMSGLLILAALALGIGTVLAARPPVDALPASYIVVFRDGVDPETTVADLMRRHGISREFVYRHVMSGASIFIPQGRLRAIADDPRVAFVERNQRVSIAVQDMPTGVERTFADESPDIGINGNDDYRIDVDVAVIDSGIDLDHPDLNVVASTNCARFGGCQNGSGNDGNGHGTHVAGTIGALDNDIGVVGVAPGARLWAVRVLDNSGSGWMSWIIAGVDWVTARAGQIEVANMSLGCRCSSSALNTAISNSVDAGVVYAVAAGNDDINAANYSPANHPDVITVSALADFDGEPGGDGSSTCRSDGDYTLANFSNWGSAVEITAPGVCIRSTYRNGGYATLSGTSMASPHVAGAAALLASGGNSPSNQAGVNAIIQALRNNGNFNWTDDSGDGVKEPLLDVSNGSVFNPVVVAGSSGSPTPAPTATPTPTPTSPPAPTATPTPTPTSPPAPTPTPTPTPSAGPSTTMTISQVVYSTGGAGGNDLIVSVTLQDGNGNPVAGATVYAFISRNGSYYAWRSGSTGTDGTVVFVVSNALAGCYTETLYVSHPNYDLEGGTPPSEPSDPFCK